MSDFKPHVALCPICHEPFFKDEVWKLTCLPCYLAKTPRRAKTPRAEARIVVVTEPIEPSMLKRLIQLCHPDRHGNSEAATLATQWLLKLRQQ